MFDTDLIREPLSAAPLQQALELGTGDGVTQPLRAMQRGRTYRVSVAGEGSGDGKPIGIFTERDILLRIVDRSRSPATLPMGKGE